MRNRNFDFVKMAKEDIQSSIILYEKAKYPQSVFLTQQAVEKLCKYLVSDRYEPKKLKSFGHDSIRLFKESLKDISKEFGGTPIKELKVFKYIISDFDDHEEEINYLKSHDLFNLNPDELDFIINSLEDLEKNVNQKIILDTTSLSDIEDLMGDMIKMGAIPEKEVRNTIQSLKKDDQLQKQFIGLYQNLFKNLPFYNNAVESTFYLALIFTSHSVQTRYIEKLNPLEFYTLDNPMVTRMPTFNHHTERTIQILADVHGFDHISFL